MENNLIPIYSIDKIPPKVEQTFDFRPHPMDSKKFTYNYKPGMTVLDLVNDLDIPRDVIPFLLVQIGGVKIPWEKWHLVRPLPGAYILISVVPKGGVLKIIAGVVLIAVAFVLLVFSWGTATPLSTGLFMMGIGLIVGGACELLFPPPKPNIANSRSVGEESSQTYALTGASNAIHPFGPVMKLYGTHKYFPNIAALPYNMWVANNQDYFIIFDLGLGKVDLQNIDIKIGETPIDSFQSLEKNFVYAPAEEFKLYNKDVSTENFQVKIEIGTPVVRNTIPAVQEVQVDIAFPQGLYSIDSNGSTVPEYVTFSVEYQDAALVWHGYSEAPYSDLGVTADTISPSKSIIINYNYTVVYPYKYPLYYYGYPAGFGIAYATYYYIKAGTTNLSANLLPANGSKVFIGGEQYTVLSNNGTTFLINRPITANVLVTINNPQNWWQTFDPYYRTSYTPPGLITFSAAKQSPVYMTVIMSGLPAATYPIRVTKISTSGAGGFKHENSMYLAQIKSIKLNTPIACPIPHTYMEVKIKANDQLSGNLTNVSVITTSILEVWDKATDTWTEKPTKNPAWIFVDILIGDINPRKIPKSKLHLDSIYEWAVECDRIRTFDMVIDGNGAEVTEPNFQCSFIMDYDSTVQQLIAQVCSAGRATFAIIGGKYGVIQDIARTTPVQVFTPRNYRGFSSSRTYKQLPHAIKVKFVDPESNWNIAEKIVYNTEDKFDEGGAPGFTAATIFEEMDTFGVNTPSFAWRQGRYFLAQAKLRQERITINVDFENLVCIAGDLVRLTSDVMEVGGYPVRIRRIVGATVYFDAPIESPGGALGFEVRQQNAIVKKGNILSVAPNGYSVVVSNSSGLNEGDLFIFGRQNTTAIDCIVESIVPGPELTAAVSLLEYAPAIFTADVLPIPPYDSQEAETIIGTTPPKIDNALLVETIIYVNREAYSRINIDLFVPANITWSSISMYKENEFGEFIFVDAIPSNTLEWHYDILASDNFKNIAKGQEPKFKFILIGVTGNHIPIEDADIYSLILKGDQVPPLPPANLSMNTQVDTLLLTWDPPEGVPDMGAYLVKYSPTFDTNISFNEFSFFIDKVPALATSAKVSFRPGQYAVRSMDTSGNVSAQSIRAIASSPDVILTKNISSYSPEVLFWPDTKKDVVVISNEIQLLQTGTNATVETGYYYFNNLLDMGEIFTCRVSSFLQGYGLELGVFLTDITWDPMANRAAMNDVAEDEAKYYLEVRLTNQTFFISFWADMASIDPIAQGAVQWSPWQKIFVGDVTTRLIEFRIVLERNSARLNITPVVKSGRVDVEIPFTQRTFTDEIVTGTRTFTFNPQFWEVPALSIIAQDLVQGDYYTITNKTLTSFDLNFFDLAGIPVTRTADIQALGTGRRYIQVLG